ncbi:MAG: cobaltochelatase subunit CobN, partial [Sphingomonadales bacterium]
ILHDYYDNGGRENFSRLVDYVAFKLIGDDPRPVPPPVIYPEAGIYAPGYEGLVFETLDAYLSWRGVSVGGKPIIGVMMQRALIEAADTQVIDDAVAALEAKGAIAIPFFFELSPVSSNYAPLIQQDGETLVDVIVNFRTIHWANKRKAEFERFGTPVVQALTYMAGDQQDWESDNQGVSPGMTPFLLVLPESAGVIDPVIVAAVNHRTGKAEIIDYQLEHLASRALKLAALRHKPNAEKKLTVMVWGDKDMGASFLNVPESLRAISGGLNAAGYNVDVVDSAYFSDPVDRILNPFYRDYELDELLTSDLAELMPVADYLAWFNSLPKEVTASINNYWGEPKNNFMVVEHNGAPHFVLPRIRNGNMLVMRQPPRADDKDEDKRIYHQGTVPMNHYYLAAYYYAREFWGSDAIIHLGTHGSHEYLNGKERGLSRYDQGNLAVWDTPVFYPFIVDDVGEAMQAKRRGAATVIAHMTPPFAAAGLQGEVADLHQLMHEYKQLDEGGVKERTAAKIKEQCVVSKICEDLAWEAAAIDADFDGFLEELHRFMEDVATASQPLGLHTFGELPEERLITSTLVQMLGGEFAARARVFEAGNYPAAGAAAVGDHYLDPGHENLEALAGFKTVRDFVLGAGAMDGLPEALAADVARGREMLANMRAITELPHLLAGLEGRYVPVKNGGDPVRHPEALPTGYNLVGFDPARLPTKAAFEQGKDLVDGVIVDYRRKHGQYPDKLAFSLWSIEAMRHYGVLESQALYAMGVRPLWSDDGRVVGTELIPARELKRPRVDVVLSATGLYRDAFPNVMKLLAEAVNKVAELKEDNNSVWENSQRIKAGLIAEGIEAEEAAYLSTVRLFSNASGAYGSGVDDAVRASDTWETDAKIADNYMGKMGYAYGADDGRWGQKFEGVNLYGKQLSGVDVAMFARSSNVYGMLSSDDPFEYFGSLALAVRALDGKSLDMVVANLRDADNARAEGAAQFLAKELRTRTLNKRWVKEMMAEGYSGSTTVASRVTNFWGWQVVDPNLVRDDQWRSFFEVYVEDAFELGVDEWFEAVNPGAQAEMIERMLEAVRKNYWAADERVQTKLVERLIELTRRHDLVTDNEKLAEFVNQKAAGFGLAAALPAPDALAAALATRQVEGRKLQKVKAGQSDSPAWDMALIGALIVSLAAFGAGAFAQSRRRLTATA